MYTANVPEPSGTSCQALRVGDFIFISGQTGIINNVLVSDDVAEQTAQCIRNIDEILKEADIDARYILRTVVYMTDSADYQAMEKVYAEFFSNPVPARTIVYVKELPYKAKVQIEAFAMDTRALEVLCASQKKNRCRDQEICEIGG